MREAKDEVIEILFTFCLVVRAMCKGLLNDAFFQLKIKEIKPYCIVLSFVLFIDRYERDFDLKGGVLDF